jgi:uncharacterized protein with PIN domain
MKYCLNDVNDNPVCPYCKAEESDWREYRGLYGDGAHQNIECPKCRKLYWVTMIVSISFISTEEK